MSNIKTTEKKMNDLAAHEELDVLAIDIEIFRRLNKTSIRQLYEYSLKHLQEKNINIKYGTFENAFRYNQERRNKNNCMNVETRRKIINIVLKLIDGQSAKILYELQKKKEQCLRKASEIREKIDAGLYNDVYEYSDEQKILHQTWDSDLDNSYYIKKNGVYKKITPGLR